MIGSLDRIYKIGNKAFSLPQDTIVEGSENKLVIQHEGKMNVEFLLVCS